MGNLENCSAPLPSSRRAGLRADRHLLRANTPSEIPACRQTGMPSLHNPPLEKEAGKDFKRGGNQNGYKNNE